MSEERLCAIFTANGIRNESRVKIEHINNMKLKKHEYVGDVLKERFDVMKGVFGEIYQCNITDVYLMVSKKLPILYVNIICEKPMRKILLFRVYLYFTIQSEIKTEKELLEKPLDGKFTMEISIESTKRELADDIPHYPGNEQMYGRLKTFVKTEEMIELIRSLVGDVEKKIREEYAKDFDYFKIPTKTISLKDYYTK